LLSSASIFVLSFFFIFMKCFTSPYSFCQLIFHRPVFLENTELTFYFLPSLARDVYDVHLIIVAMQCHPITPTAHY
jgi:hypothetical protein